MYKRHANTHTQRNLERENGSAHELTRIPGSAQALGACAPKGKQGDPTTNNEAPMMNVMIWFLLRVASTRRLEAQITQRYISAMRSALR